MRITNRKAKYDYHILESFEAGISLTGAEVKSVKQENMSLNGSFVKIINDEIFLINALINPYKHARQDNYDAKRTRKLLLKKKEIISIKSKIDQGKLTLVPLECYNRGAWIKVKVALAKGKKRFEKRETLKRRDIDREVEREVRGKN